MREPKYRHPGLSYEDRATILYYIRAPKNTTKTLKGSKIATENAFDPISAAKQQALSKNPPRRPPTTSIDRSRTGRTNDNGGEWARFTRGPDLKLKNLKDVASSKIATNDCPAAGRAPLENGEGTNHTGRDI